MRNKKTYVYLVSMSGYEWNDPIKVFSEKQTAKEYADTLTKNPPKNKWLANISTFEVTKLELI